MWPILGPLASTRYLSQYVTNVWKYSKPWKRTSLNLKLRNLKFETKQLEVRRLLFLNLNVGTVGMLFFCWNRGEHVSMGHFKKLELGLYAYVSHIGSNKGRTWVETYIKHMIYIKIIYKQYDIPPHPHLPEWQTNPAYGNIFICRYIFDDFPWFLWIVVVCDRIVDG